MHESLISCAHARASEGRAVASRSDDARVKDYTAERPVSACSSGVKSNLHFHDVTYKAVYTPEAYFRGSFYG